MYISFLNRHCVSATFWDHCDQLLILLCSLMKRIWDHVHPKCGRPFSVCSIFFSVCTTVKRRSGDGRSPLIRKNGSWDCNIKGHRVLTDEPSNSQAHHWHAIVGFQKTKKRLWDPFAGNPKKFDFLLRLWRKSGRFLSFSWQKSNRDNWTYVIIRRVGNPSPPSSKRWIGYSCCFKVIHLKQEMIDF